GFSVRSPMSERCDASTRRWKQGPTERTSSAIRCCSSGVLAAFPELGQPVGEMDPGEPARGPGVVFRRQAVRIVQAAGGDVDLLQVFKLEGQRRAAMRAERAHPLDRRHEARWLSAYEAKLR